MFEAKVLCDSVNSCNNRLITFELTFPRMILAEMNTHKNISKNAASSRAIPVEKMIRQVAESPFIPVYWGKAQKGMQAYEEVSPENIEKCKAIWIAQRDIAVKAAEEMLSLGLHKQIPNRLLENWMWCTVITTGNIGSWNNFWNLRNHHAAEPHMQIIANMCENAANNSTPNKLEDDQWHLPLIGFEGDDQLTESEKAMVSVGRCARVSYLTHDGKRDVQADIDLCKRLQNDGHFSPFEHVALSSSGVKREECLSGNLGAGWIQYRKMIQGEFKDKR